MPRTSLVSATPSKQYLFRFETIKLGTASAEVSLALLCNMLTQTCFRSKELLSSINAFLLGRLGRNVLQKLELQIFCKKS